MLILLLFFPMIFMVVIMCYAPMKNHLRYTKRATILTISIICAILSVATFISTGKIRFLYLRQCASAQSVVAGGLSGCHLLRI